jgi:hypothetical protein
MPTNHQPSPVAILQLEHAEIRSTDPLIVSTLFRMLGAVVTDNEHQALERPYPI